MKYKNQIVNYILVEKGFILPKSIYNIEVIKELEKELDRKIRTKSAFLVSKYLKQLSENIDLFIETEKIIENIELINKRLLDLKNKYKECDKYFVELTQEDEKLISFMSNRSLSTFENFKMIGIYYYIIDVLEKINHLKLDKEYKNLIVSSLLWVYLNMYELILHEIDRRIYSDDALLNKLKKLGDDNNTKIYKTFVKRVNRDSGKHATKKTLLEVLSILDIIDKETDSMVSETSKLRNLIAHANIFYNEEQDVLQSLGKDEWPICCLIKEILYLDLFFKELFYKQIRRNENLDYLKEKLKQDLLELSKIFKHIERSGDLKTRYINKISDYLKGIRIEISEEDETDDNIVCP